MKLILSKIKSHRIQLGLSQEAIAHELNITQKSYSKIESGETNLSLERFLEICNLLDLSPISTIILGKGFPERFKEKIENNDIKSISEYLEKDLKEIKLQRDLLISISKRILSVQQNVSVF